MSEERLQFQAEVSRLLEIVAKSLYSHKEVFLRELISNSSDACDRLRYAALTDPSLTADDAAFRIGIIVDKTAHSLTIADNGIGMNRDDLVELLGTIARSGTLQFVDQLTGDSGKDMQLIGQFGVGFYSTFMVADRVTVLTRKAGSDQGWRWESDGRGEFTIAEADGVPRGTQVVITLSESEAEFLEDSRLRQIVKTYSDHIAIPIHLKIVGAEPDGEGDSGDGEQLNRASALWTRSKSEISDEDYKEFYHHVGHAFDDPWLTLHYRAEGMIEYTALVFVPTMAPFDLYHPERKHRLKLYVRRVFVTDAAEGLLPSYLRFLRGVIDSEDLPLNVSREMLQNNPLVAKIRQGVTKRVLTELGRKATDAPEDYDRFWEQFGAVIKEGLYEDHENREALQGLLRFRSTGVDGLTGLDDAVARMKEGQEALFYITGDDIEMLRRSPQIEGFRAKGVEVMLLTDPVDDFWISSLGFYKDTPFKSVTRGGADLGKIKAETADGDTPKPEGDDAADSESDAGIDALVARFKLTLKDAVKDVRASERLTDSPVCLVADEGDMDMHLERLLKQHKQLGLDEAKRILEINPDHPLVKQLTGLAGKPSVESGDVQVLEDMAYILLDQARIIEGEPLPDPAAFSRRLSQALQKGVSLDG